MLLGTGIAILWDRWTDELGEHIKTKAQLERVEEREKNRSAENDQLRQERTNLRKENEELKRLHPILQFYGPRAKHVTSYDLRKEAGEQLVIGNCPQIPCVRFTIQGIEKPSADREARAHLTFDGVWEGGSSNIQRGLGFWLPLKKGCRATIQVARYNIDFILEDDRYLDMRAGIGISLDVHFVSPSPVHSPLGVGAQHAAPLRLPLMDWWCIYETDI